MNSSACRIRKRSLLWFFWVFFWAHPALGSENPLAYRPIDLNNNDNLSEKAPDFLSRVGLALLTFYAKTLSPLNGQSCPLDPSCSQYAVQALHRHGAFVGMLLTVDRLIHERTQIFTGKRRQMADGQVRVIDELNDNDFWLRPVGRSDTGR